MRSDLFRISLVFVYLIETIILHVTLGVHQKQSSPLEELKSLDMKLNQKLLVLQKLQSAIMFLKVLSKNFLEVINEINDENKITSIEIHNMPSLNFDEQYSFIEQVSKTLFKQYNDQEITGLRIFFTNDNLMFRKMMVSFKSYSIKSKWFSAFINMTKRLGFSRLKDFPGLNITLYDGTIMRGITLRDHLSKHKSSVLKVAQGFLTRFRSIKCFVSDSLIYAERKIGRDMFIRYLLRNFEDVKNLKELFLKDNVPTICNSARVDITPNPAYVIFTKNSRVKPKETNIAESWKKIETYWRGDTTKYIFYENRITQKLKHRKRGTTPHWNSTSKSVRWTFITSPLGPIEDAKFSLPA